MENIHRAIAKARDGDKTHTIAPQLAPLSPDRARVSPVGSSGVREVQLSLKHLEEERIVAHDRSDERCKSFDMLRTQVTQTMDAQSAQILAVTSPTAACGKTLNAINLTMAIARQPERSILLIDMDLHGPQVSKRLGINCDVGLIDVLEGKVAYRDALVQCHVGGHEFLLLPSRGDRIGTHEWPSAKSIATLLKELKQEDPHRTILLDLPPLLSGDEVISILPHVDGVLFVVAAGTTTKTQLKECGRHLQGSSIIRVVMNRSPEPGIAPYGFNHSPERALRRGFFRRRKA